MDECQLTRVIFYPTWQSFYGNVTFSAMALSSSSRFSPRHLPNLANLSFPFPKQKKLRPYSMNLLNSLFHKLICSHFYFLIQQRINVRQSLCPDPTCHLSELNSLFFNFILCSSARPVPSAYGHTQIFSVEPKETNSPLSFSVL